MGPRNNMLDEGQDQMNPFASAKVTSWRCGHLLHDFGHVFHVIVDEDDKHGEMLLAVNHERKSLLVCIAVRRLKHNRMMRCEKITLF